MKKITNLPLLFILLSILQPGTKVSAQNNPRWGISATINSIEAQIGEPEWDSWGYANGNFHNFGDIRNNSISLSIIPKYFIRSDILLRLEFGITNINLRNYYDANAHLTSNNPSSTNITNQSIRQKVYRYSPGIQWTFMKKKTIESYCGMTVSYLHYSDMKYHHVFEMRALSNNTITDGFEDNATATGGFATGVGFFAGFNIYLNNHISLGAESSFSLLYYKIGGSFKGVSTPLINNVSGMQVYSYTTNSYKGFQFSKVLPSINISVWF